MSKFENYRSTLRSLACWDEFLQAESALPGPRANLELAFAAAEEGGERLFERYLAIPPEMAPENTPGVFLVFIGVLGLGNLLAQGRQEMLPVLRRLAGDPRWRIREAVGMALQKLGDADMDALLSSVRPWSLGNPYEQRAAAAALCEPRLLGEERHVQAVLEILEEITKSIVDRPDRKTDDFQALRKGLSYCWSVAVAACSEIGKPRMEKWIACPDPQIRRIMKENLKKDRLRRVDLAWVERMNQHLASMVDLSPNPC